MFNSDAAFAAGYVLRVQRLYLYIYRYIYIRAKSGAAPLRSSKGREEEGRESVWGRVGNGVSVLVSFAACLAKGRDCLYPGVSGILCTREREGQRDGDRETETERRGRERHRERETGTQTDRQTETETERRERERDRETDRDAPVG